MRYLLFLLLLGLPALALAAQWRSQGEVSVESRVFSDDGDAATRDDNASLVPLRGNLALFARLEISWRQGPWRLAFRAFGRADHADDERSLTAIEEAWVDYRRGVWELRFGAQMLDWTATEAFHPADTINSRNLDSDLERPEKLGELMLSVRRRLGSGSVTAYWLPRYQAPVFPSRRSRLAFVPPEVEVGGALWIEDDGMVAPDSFGHQWGLRLTRNLGSADLGLHVLRHQDRQQPVFRFDAEGRLRPLYLPVLEVGGTWLQVAGAWVLKIEFSHRDFDNPALPVDLGDSTAVAVSRLDHSQLAVGIEWGWTYSSGADATLLWEAQSVLGVDAAERSQLAVFQRDALIGYRHSWNDVRGRVLLATIIFDLEREHELLFNLRYQQRLSDTWSVETGLRRIDAPVKGHPPGGIEGGEHDSPRGLELLDGSDQLFLNLRRYF